MSSFLGVHSISKAHGTQVLFRNISFTISQGDRIGLIGPNGSGKSSLLKILCGDEEPDEGNLSMRQGLRIGYARQVPEFPSMSLEEVLINEIKGGDPVEKLTKARILLGKAQFADSTQNASTLSGGWKKRLDIVRALMTDPDLMLLDEPTNHLDLEGILWLEKFLMKEKLTYVVVSHDRYFLENVSGKIIEINKCYPAGIFISEGGMGAYMEHKEAFLLGQEQQQQELKMLVKQETDWLKRSPKARTTKSQSRVKNAYRLIEELSAVKQRNKIEKVDINFTSSERETRRLLVATNIAKTLGGKQLFKGVNIVLSPGTRLGIVGLNGTGKTTLLKMLAKMIPVDMGTIKYAEDLRLVYFDQHREHIPPETSLRRALSPNSDNVNYRGQWIHVNGWAKKFLFSPDRLELPVRCLSGGEQARILIAKLILEPADILFLDEPTNDLDIQTLEVLEESLNEFPGAVVLISHDRCLMDRVCTSIIGLGQDNEQQFYADYAQWEAACQEQLQAKKAAPKFAAATKSEEPLKKLSYNEKKELEGMEQTIQHAEAKIEKLQKDLEDPSKHLNSQQSIDLCEAVSTEQEKLDKLYERWQELLDRNK